MVPKLLVRCHNEAQETPDDRGETTHKTKDHVKRVDRPLHFVPLARLSRLVAEMRHVVSSYVFAQHRGVHFEVLHVCAKVEGVDLRGVKPREVEIIDLTSGHSVGQVDLQVVLELELVDCNSYERHETVFVKLFWSEESTYHRGVDEVILDIDGGVSIVQVDLEDQTFVVFSITSIQLVG